MFTYVLNKIIAFFAICFQGLSWFFSYIFNHAWALFCSIFSIVASIFIGVIRFFDSLINDIVSPIQNINGLVFGDSLSDVVNSVIINHLPNDSFFSACFLDVVYVFNIGGLFSSIVTIFIPVLTSVFLYKLVKSWIPTVSGS